jgi:hypothetical protein
MTQFHPALLSRYLAPGIADFTSAEIADRRPAHPQAQYWLTNHFLNNLVAEFRGNGRQFVVNLIFRAQTAFAFFHQARDTTLRYLRESGPESPKVGVYYEAIGQWEACFLNFQIFIDVRNQLDVKVFEENDGSPEQRAYGIANTIKHWGKQVSRKEHHDDHTLPMWLSNTGFQSKRFAVTYSEFAAMIDEVANVADELQDARRWTNRNAAVKRAAPGTA